MGVGTWFSQIQQVSHGFIINGRVTWVETEVWVGRYKIHANIPRFHREPLNKHSNIHDDNGVKKGTNLNPALVLDDSCLNQKDYSLCLMGKVKDFASLSKLKVVLVNEGFSNIKLRYMGGYWVMIEFQSFGTMKSFQANMGVGTWFSQIQQVSHDFIIDGRVTWVEIKGMPLKMWSKNTFNHVASKWGVLLDVDDKEDGCLHSKRICINTKVSTNIFESFKVIYRGKVVWVRAIEVPGWVLDFVEDNEEENESDDESYEDEPNVGDLKNVKDLEGDSDGDAVPDTKFDEEPHIQNDAEVLVGQNNVQSEDPFNLYELLNKKRDDTTKDFNSDDSLRYPSGFTPRDNIDDTGDHSYGSNENIEQNIVQEGETLGEKNAVSIQKSKNNVEESICSGHFKKSEMPRSGGSILLLIDELVKALPKRPKKIRGEWVSNGKKLLMISVYAPQELTEKKMLWDHLSNVMSNWECGVVVMVDFNEVRNKDERFGSVFNKQGADVFNSFISNAGLAEVPLGGCSFTWCHKSTTKMSKLDRFLILNSLMCSCPNISLISLDHYLSDHCPILMREAFYDYGPVLFRFFHYRFEMEDKIRIWNRSCKEKMNNRKRSLKAELAEFDFIIDKGEVEADVVNIRNEVVKLLQVVEKIHVTPQQWRKRENAT
nr:nucleotide-binding alpha-beta plait domain-containing protein [Tanacetum cinerariifolium]